MLWFGQSKKEREKRMNMISSIKPTSKASLKMQCLIISHGDVDEANKLYDFYAKDMPELPPFDVEPPTWMESAKGNALGFYQFIKENKDDIAQAIDFVRSILTKNNPAQEAVEVIPPINEVE